MRSGFVPCHWGAASTSFRNLLNSRSARQATSFWIAPIIWKTYAELKFASSWQSPPVGRPQNSTRSLSHYRMLWSYPAPPQNASFVLWLSSDNSPNISGAQNHSCPNVQLGIIWKLTRTLKVAQKRDAHSIFHTFHPTPQSYQWIQKGG